MSDGTLIFEPTQVWLELAREELTRAWQQSQSFVWPNCRWNAYLNQLTLSAVLPWVQEEYAPAAKPWPSRAALLSFWQAVTGTAIELDNARLVFVPTDTIDLSELRVPQEWVDIPSWAGDYYIAAQVNPDEGGVLLWGYTTHEHLKTAGIYDSRDRTYCLPSDELILDLNVLWVARQLCPQETTRAALAPLPILPQKQAENLLVRLGNPDIAEPRLAVPFELWGALLEHGGTRQQLYERRLGLPEQWSVKKWLSAGVSELAENMGWGLLELQANIVGARGEESPAERSVCRQLIIAGQPYELRVFPLDDSDQPVWRFQLRNTSSGGLIPGGFKLRLLTEDLQAFENNEDVAEQAREELFIEVSLAPGEGLVWETEPFPDKYDREILRF
jgi:hypothetical protein